jgi:hypothetical protein
MGKSACSARRCGTRNQNKQAPPVLLPKEDTALSHKQPVSGQLHMPVRKPKTACTAVLVQYEFRPGGDTAHVIPASVAGPALSGDHAGSSVFCSLAIKRKPLQHLNPKRDTNHGVLLGRFFLLNLGPFVSTALREQTQKTVM